MVAIRYQRKRSIDAKLFNIMKIIGHLAKKTAVMLYIGLGMALPLSCFKKYALRSSDNKCSRYDLMQVTSICCVLIFISLAQ